MNTANLPAVTKDELVNAYWRSKLPTIGLSFHQAMQADTVRWSLTRSALSHRAITAAQVATYQTLLNLEETL